MHPSFHTHSPTQPRLLIYLKLLIMPMPIMIWLAVIVEAAIQNWIDMVRNDFFFFVRAREKKNPRDGKKKILTFLSFFPVPHFSPKKLQQNTLQAILLAIQFINATIGWYETVKAADAVAALKASLKPLATVKRDGVWNNVDAGGVVPGDLVLLASGSAVPADCIVNEGQIDVDASALTGESLPITVKRGGAAQMGSTVVRGEVNGTVQHTGKDTFFGRTAMLLQQVSDERRWGVFLFLPLLFDISRSLLISHHLFSSFSTPKTSKP